jgi:membrane fusion protein, multidrug efflux system
MLFLAAFSTLENALSSMTRRVRSIKTEDDGASAHLFRRACGSFASIMAAATIAAVAGAATLLLAGCSGGGKPQMVMPPVPVTTAAALEKTVPNRLQEIGTVEAYSSVSIKSRVEGQLVGVYFKEGDYVKQGQLLFQLDQRPFKAGLAQAEANLRRDEAQAKQAETDAQRYTYLLKMQVGSRQQYDLSHANAASLAASVAADSAAVQTARLNLQYTEIHSPIDGKTGNLKSHVGDLIKADADTPMVIVNQVQPIYVDFYIPEGRLGEVRQYMSERELKTLVAIPGQQDVAEGKLSFVDNTVDKTTGQILLKGLFENTDRRLWPGQFVNVTLTLSEIPNTVMVPSQAVQTGQQGSYVFVVGHDQKVEPRPVVTGTTLDNETIIESGLRKGEVVVTDGQLRLVPGSRVIIKDSPKGSSGAAL